MRTISVQVMPNGFEVETPTFWYWMKAGIAFTLGAGIVTFVAVVSWVLVSFTVLAGILGGHAR
jgi:hypothetical protein